MGAIQERGGEVGFLRQQSQTNLLGSQFHINKWDLLPREYMRSKELEAQIFVGYEKLR